MADGPVRAELDEGKGSPRLEARKAISEIATEATQKLRLIDRSSFKNGDPVKPAIPMGLQSQRLEPVEEILWLTFMMKKRNGKSKSHLMSITWSAGASMTHVQFRLL